MLYATLPILDCTHRSAIEPRTEQSRTGVERELKAVVGSGVGLAISRCDFITRTSLGEDFAFLMGTGINERLRSSPWLPPTRATLTGARASGTPAEATRENT